MPELPEVETIAANLRGCADGGQPSIIGCRVKEAQVLWARALANLDPCAFCTRIAGQEVLSIGRRGKFLVLSLSPDTLLLHLRMSGDVRVQSDAKPKELHQHDRLALTFDCGQCLVFNDPRKFGRAWLVEDPQEVLGRLGPEALDEELTAETFFEMLKRRSHQLKPLLMDQTFLAGLGNIYTDEALHAARLHPTQSASQITKEQATDLLTAIQAVLREGIRRNGASIDWVYRGGSFQNTFQVYGRAGQPCLTCGATIQRLVVGQRGTHICPNCQQRYESP